MTRPLWALTGVVLLSAAGVSGAVVVVSSGGEEEVVEQVQLATPTLAVPSEAAPVFCPPTTPSDCYTPPEPVLTYVPLGPYVINGVTIPLPDGAVHSFGISEPTGGFHTYETEHSILAFSGRGWLWENKIAESEKDKFAPAIEALHKVAEPITFNGVVIPVPAGALAHPPIMEFADGWAGPADKAPNLFVIELGNSYLSWDLQGNVVGDQVKSEDAAVFAQIRETLSLARQQ